MNKYIVVIVIALVLLGGGVYFYKFSSNNTTKPTESDNTQTGMQHNPSSSPQVPDSKNYQIEVVSDISAIQSNKPYTFIYKIKNDQGEVVKDFEVVHEKMMHFIGVRKDLQNFLHLHPEFNTSTGEFSVAITFPANGPYRLFPDFTPTANNPQKQPVTLFADVNVGDMSKYQAQAVVVDTQPKKTVGGYQIDFAMPSDLMKQKELTYSLNIEQNGKAVTNLEDYLGALGHSVIIKEGTLDFIHTHANDSIGTGGDMQHSTDNMAQGAKGPKISFTTTFPDSGIYKIFTQFQHMGKVNTVDYAVKVN